MNKTMKVLSVLTAVTLAASAAMAQHRGGDFHGGTRSAFGHYDSGRHYSSYHGSCGSIGMGLLGLGIFAAVVSAADRPVYVQQPVVYQAPSPVVYVQPAPVVTPPAVVYQAPVVVQQPAVVEPTQPVTTTIHIQNTNGSYTPIVLRQVGNQWIGPKGEYYESLPTVGQLRPVYGF